MDISPPRDRADEPAQIDVHFDGSHSPRPNGAPDDVRHGEGHDEGHDEAHDARRDGWTAEWITGPDSGAGFPLPLGSTIVGRAPTAEVRCDDPAVLPHHVLIERASTTLRITQLSGRMPLGVDGRQIPSSGTIEIDVADEVAGVVVDIGHSRLRLHRLASGDRGSSAHQRNGAILRTPRSVPVWDPAPLALPRGDGTSRQLPGGLLPALIGLAGSGVLALVMHQPMFLMFGALGAVAALGSWIAQRVGLVRSGRRSARSLRSAMDAFRGADADLRAAFIRHLHSTTSTTSTAHVAIRCCGAQLWSRRPEHGDAFRVSLGTGEISWSPPLIDDSGTTTGQRYRSGQGVAAGSHSAATAHDRVLGGLPITTDLGVGARLALCGPNAATAAMARALIVQLAANCGPADVRFIVVTHELAAWRWAMDLPHAAGADGAPTVIGPADLPGLLATLDQPALPHLVFVTDATEVLASRTSPLRRAVTADTEPALIALVPPDGGIPHLCTAVLHLPASPSLSSAAPARWVADASSNALALGVQYAGIGVAAARRLATALSGLSDPDDPFAATSGVPSSVSLTELLSAEDGRPLTPASVAARWLAGGPDPSPRTPIGLAADGVVDIDLVRDGPHGLIAGTTGSGKSELLRSMVAGMAVCASPDHLTFVLVDYKGGSTFDACAALPHVVGVVTDLDDALADRALRSLHAELRRREGLLREHGASDLTALRELRPDVVLPRLVVVIDEFAALVAEQPDFLHALIGVAQRGRSLGVHLLLATQRPSGVISDDIRANTNIRIALRLQDAADAVDVVGDTSPTLFQRRLAGRAVVRLGPDEHVTFQTARCTATAPSELDAVVRAVREATKVTGVAMPIGPWQPPLPTQLEVADLDDPDGEGLGLVDDPDHQRITHLTWNPRNDPLLIAGGPGSGVTTTLISLGWHALQRDPAAHIYVIDAHSDDALLALADHPRCGAVVRLHERERLLRLLTRLAPARERPAANQPPTGRSPTGRPPTGQPPRDRPIVLLIDGFDQLRQALDDLDTAAECAALDAILATGTGGALTVVLAVGHAAAVPAAITARIPLRWVLHLADRHDAHGWGIAPAEVPGPTPGRIAIGGGLHAQLARPPAGARLHLAADRAADASAAAVIECLPEHLSASVLGEGRVALGSAWLPLGLDFATGDEAVLDVPDGEHVLIVGPARTGRSTALARFVAAWREARPDGWVGMLSPRRRPGPVVSTHPHLADLLADVPVAGPVLLAIDDADVIDDVGGALAALAAGRRPDLLIVAVGTPDALRQAYGHWTSVVRRSRIGVVMAACNDLDGDLVGATLPRRMPVRPRPGLAWVTVNGTTHLTQIAHDDIDGLAGRGPASAGDDARSAGHR